VTSQFLKIQKLFGSHLGKAGGAGVRGEERGRKTQPVWGTASPALGVDQNPLALSCRNC
jgi:hypothetical protein